MYFDILVHLEDVNSIESGNETEVLNIYRHVGVNFIHDGCSNRLVIVCNGKAIYLAEK